MKLILTTLSLLGILLPHGVQAQTFIGVGSTYTIKEDGSYYTAPNAPAYRIIINEGVHATIANSDNLGTNELRLGEGASLSFHTNFYIRDWDLRLTPPSSALASITAKTGGASIVSESGTPSYSNLTLTNVEIYTDKTGNVMMDNVTLAGRTLTQGGVRISANNLTLDWGTYSRPINEAIVQGASTTVRGSLILDMDFAAGTDLNNVSIKLGPLTLEEGADIIINGYEFVGEGFTSNGVGSYEFNGAIRYIPEPSTATLSLIALAGLLARRRRKAA